VVKDRFSYQSKKLSEARLSLMAPHLEGEDRSFAGAFQACSGAFHRFDATRVKDENALGWIETIKRLMDTSGVEDPTGEGTWVKRARLMTSDEKYEFSRAVDELANWFNREYWSGS
jgi:hypothetical protein